MTEPLLELDHVTKRFGRVVIAEDLSFTRRIRGHGRDRGAERSGQDQPVRPHFRRPVPGCRERLLRRAHRDQARLGGPVQARHRPHLPGTAALHGHDRVRERAGRRPAGRRAAAPGQLRGGRRGPRAGRHDRRGEPARRTARPAAAQAAGTRPRARVAAEAAAARRGGRRPDRPGSRAIGRDHPRGERRGHHGDLDRARGAGAGAGGDQADLPGRREVRRGRRPGAGAGRPGGPRGLPRLRGHRLPLRRHAERGHQPGRLRERASDRPRKAGASQYWRSGT